MKTVRESNFLPSLSDTGSTLTQALCGAIARYAACPATTRCEIAVSCQPDKRE